MTQSEKCQEIVLRYQAGDKSALDELVDNIEGIIKSLCKKYYTLAEFDDLYQMGWLAVMKCVQGYKPDSKTMFTSYAYRAIENEFIQYVNKQNKHKSKYDDDGNCLIGFIPIDSQVSNKSYAESYMTVGDTIADETQDVEMQAIVDTVTPIIFEILSTFSNANQHQMLVWYLEGKQQIWIANELNVTGAYVSKTIKTFNNKCLDKLNK